MPGKIPGRFNRKFYKDVRWKDEYDQDGFDRTPAKESDAEVVSSELDYAPGIHAPVLDIDVPAYLIPSSTPGHSHLYIDQAMTWREYKKLLRVMAACGILEMGYVRACISRKHTAVRVPWLKKTE